MIGILSGSESIDLLLQKALALSLTSGMTSAILTGEDRPEARQCAIKPMDPKIIGEAYIQGINWAKDVPSNTILS